MDKTIQALPKRELERRLSHALQALTLITELHPTKNSRKHYAEMARFLAECGLCGYWPETE